MKKINDEKIERAIRSSKSSVEMEGIETSSKVDEIIRKKLKNEIGEEEALMLIEEYTVNKK